LPTVVIAYSSFLDFDIEQKIFDEAGFDVVYTGTLETSEALEAASKADAIMVSLNNVTPEILDHLHNCKIITRVGVGVDAINIPAATERGIWVTNVPDYSVDEVSTHAVALLLNYARRLPALFNQLAQGAWWNINKVESMARLNQQTVGIIGYGRIGQAAAAKFAALGSRVIACDPYIKPEALPAHPVPLVDLETLLRESDYVSLHTPLNETSFHLINAQTLALMKPNAYLVNTARGAVVDTDALLEAVQAGKIAGAALDVLEAEPPDPNAPLLHEPRILITPHAAWYSQEANVEVHVKGAEDVVRVLRGERPRTPVNQIEKV
jgi:D-3-phosphoglycerate dehydrogenase